MSVSPVPGDAGGLSAAIRAAAKSKTVTAIASQGEARPSVHVVHGDGKTGSGGVDDGAHGTHDYSSDLHVQVLDRLHAHGSKLDEHDARITRLEAGQGAKLGSPQH
jgi:hypothetical protein